MVSFATGLSNWVARPLAFMPSINSSVPGRDLDIGKRAAGPRPQPDTTLRAAAQRFFHREAGFRRTIDINAHLRPFDDMRA